MNYKTRVIDNLCNRVDFKGGTFYVCKSPFDNTYYADYDLKKAQNKVLKGIEKMEIISKGKTYRRLFPPRKNEATYDEDLDKYYDYFLDATVKNSMIYEKDHSGKEILVGAKCPFCDKIFKYDKDSKVPLEDQVVLHIEQNPDHVDDLEYAASERQLAENSYKREVNENGQIDRYESEADDDSEGEE
ncbi:MAG: hypothetical protein QXL94_05670 [Candidatus Parvarchaeum sp.]